MLDLAQLVWDSLRVWESSIYTILQSMEMDGVMKGWDEWINVNVGNYKKQKWVGMV